MTHTQRQQVHARMRTHATRLVKERRRRTRGRRSSTHYRDLVRKAQEKLAGTPNATYGAGFLGAGVEVVDHGEVQGGILGWLAQVAERMDRGVHDK